MATKANRTRAAQKRIDSAKRQYGLAPGTGAAILKYAEMMADSPWTVIVTLATFAACVVVFIL